MIRKISVILLIGCLAFVLRCPAEKIIQTANGSIRGVRVTSERQHVDFHAFRGIPYGKPPIGDLRFKVFHCDLVEQFTKTCNAQKSDLEKSLTMTKTT